MKVIAEFVDSRNGNRYFPGDGNKIDPALEQDQIDRLKKAGCLAEGAEAAKPASTLTNDDDEDADLSKLSVADLKALAAERKVDIAACKNKGDLIAALEAAAKSAPQAQA